MFGKNRVLLLVEDEPATRRQLEEHLKKLQFEVLTAGDYHGAVKVLEEHKVHVICLDLTLPRESGFELCEYVRNHEKISWVPILVISERASPEDMAHAEDVGANAYLKKPFQIHQFTKYLNVLLDGPNASRPSFRRLRPVSPPKGDTES
jgi:DNA-binding response OmpR family regulator